MSKEIETLELNTAIIEIANASPTNLDDALLALVGGGECTVNP